MENSMVLAIFIITLLISVPVLMLVLRKKTGSAELEQRMDDHESSHPMVGEWRNDSPHSPEDERIRKDEEQKHAS